MKFLRDTWLTFQRAILTVLRNPVGLLLAGFSLLLVLAPQTIASFNPFAHSLFNGNLIDAVMWGFLIMLVLGVLVGVWGLQSFRKKVA